MGGKHSNVVMPALVAGIHVLKARARSKTWMAGTPPRRYGGSPGHDDVDASKPKTVASMRGQRRGLLLDRRLGRRRRLGGRGCLLLLVPFDRLERAGQRVGDHLVHAR